MAVNLRLSMNPKLRGRISLKPDSDLQKKGMKAKRPSFGSPKGQLGKKKSGISPECGRPAKGKSKVKSRLISSSSESSSESEEEADTGLR